MAPHELDPKERLIAALYEELPADEEAQFARDLEHDPELRSEFEELQGTRRLMAKLDAEETESAPGFVFLAPDGDRRRTGWSRFRAALPVWGTGLAAAALAVAVLAGLRVDRVSGGFAVRFGGPEMTRVETLGDAGDAVPQTLNPPADLNPTVTPVSQTGDYLTTQDLGLYHNGFLRMMNDRLTEYAAERDQRMVAVLNSFYDELSAEQRARYSELRSQINGVGLGLMVEQSRNNARIQSLFEQADSSGSAPALNPTPNSPDEDEQHD